MWMNIIGFLGGPVVKMLLDAYKAHLAAGNTDNQTAATLAAAEIAAQTAEINATTQLKVAEIGHPFEPEKLAFYLVLAYMAKVIVWDNMMGLGSTPAVHGDVAVWMGLVVSFYFTKRGAERVTQIIQAIKR